MSWGIPYFLGPWETNRKSPVFFAQRPCIRIFAVIFERTPSSLHSTTRKRGKMLYLTVLVTMPSQVRSSNANPPLSPNELIMNKIPQAPEASPTL